MSGFLTTLQVEAMVNSATGTSLCNRSGRRLFKLLSTLQYRTWQGWVLTIDPGFITDFGSVPRIPLIFDLLGDITYEPYVIHDMLYTTHYLTRLEADRVLQEALLAVGVPKWKASLIYFGVRIGGASSWNDK
jgi:hypothetical protein